MISLVPSRTFSNASLNDPPERGGVNGGYLAKLLLDASTGSIELEAQQPRVVNVQFVSPPAFEPMTLDVEVLRRSRNSCFVSARIGQAGQTRAVGQLCYGQSEAGPHQRTVAMPAALDPEACIDAQLPDGLWPHFSQHCDYRIATVPAPVPFSGAERAEMLCWIRLRHMPLDAGGLLFLFDAMFPAFFLAATTPLRTVTTDFNVAFANTLPDRAGSDWVLMRLQVRDWTGGWCIEDAEAWSANGLLLGVARQMRRVFVRDRGVVDHQGRQILQLPHRSTGQRREVVGAGRHG